MQRTWLLPQPQGQQGFGRAPPPYPHPPHQQDNQQPGTSSQAPQQDYQLPGSSSQPPQQAYQQPSTSYQQPQQLDYQQQSTSSGMGERKLDWQPLPHRWIPGQTSFSGPNAVYDSADASQMRQDYPDYYGAREEGLQSPSEFVPQQPLMRSTSCPPQTPTTTDLSFTQLNTPRLNQSQMSEPSVFASPAARHRLDTSDACVVVQTAPPPPLAGAPLATRVPSPSLVITHMQSTSEQLALTLTRQRSRESSESPRSTKTDVEVDVEKEQEEGQEEQD